jgi:hypothetical protein
VPDYISIIGYLAMVFLPLYIPIAVTIVGGIRSRRDDVVASPVVDPLRKVVTPAHVDRASVNTPAAPTVMAQGRDAVLVTARPVVEPV